MMFTYQFRLGCKAATIESTTREESMSESSNHIESSSLFNTISNEHTLFAGTLRDWCDPLLQGQERIPVSLCPRCASCRCESLKDLSNSSHHSKRQHQHQRNHDPSCPKYRQHERTKSTSKRRVFNKPKRRAISHDPSIALTDKLVERTPSPSLTYRIERRETTSKIPIRISTSSSVATTSEYSPASSINSSRSSNMKTKIPRPISNQHIICTPLVTYSTQSSATTDEDLNDYDHDHDSLQGDTCQKLPTMSENEFYNMDISSKKKKKNIMMLYCTTNGTNQLDHIDEQNLLKKKKTKMSSLLKTHSHSESSSEKRRRKFWHRESMYPSKYSNRFPFRIL
ncbi:unnamed protein product [Rotaria socialis]|nr:unnamed protein product [Rotaria socialis]CAF3325470.1 unnamed protein product [Rotaria socialis]CAF4133633.1 unnamed protein product [Rotaria socialis]CAF4234532.1 unnamed protein product [Rotaria socialis]